MVTEQKLELPLHLVEARNFLGKTVTDPYGRVLGRLVGVTTNVRDETTTVEIESGKGDFEEVQSKQLRVNGESLVVLPWWKLEAEEFRKEFELVTRRTRALDELFSLGDIDGEIYQDLRKLHEDSIANLKGRRKLLLDSLQTRTANLFSQTRQLQTHLANNKMLHAAGEVDDFAYKTAVDIIDAGLTRSSAEKRDIEAISSFLKRLESMHLEQVSSQASETGQPSILTVHVREE